MKNQIITILIVALLIFAMEVTFVKIPEVNATSTVVNRYTLTGLSVEGNQVFTANGAPLVLKGMDYTYFMNSESGSWMLPGGSIEWATWDPTGVSDFLNFMQASNANVVRCFLTVQFWLDNSNNYQSNLEYFINQATDRGIYTDLVFWSNNATGSEPTGVLPWNDAGNNVLNSSADFVNLWGNVSDTLKSYPTVLYELWNEPNSYIAGDEAIWFNVAQQCINRIRFTGATQPIIIQWDSQINYDFNSGYNDSMQWVFDYPLSDPLGNLIYSTHIYSAGNYGFYTSSNYTIMNSYADCYTALAECKVFAVAAVHPVFIGEIGDNLWLNAADQDTFFNNTLTILDQNRIGYAGFAAPPWASGQDNYGYVMVNTPNYTLDNAGIILVTHLGGMSYAAWLTPQALTVSVLPTSCTMNICQNEMFTATASGGSSIYTGYQWYVNGVAQPGQTASTFNYSPTSTGSYSITATATDSSGTTSAQSSAATVTAVNTPPTPTPSATSTKTSGSQGGLSQSSAGGTPSPAGTPSPSHPSNLNMIIVAIAIVASVSALSVALRKKVGRVLCKVM